LILKLAKLSPLFYFMLKPNYFQEKTNEEILKSSPPLSLAAASHQQSKKMKISFSFYFFS
jgi:hypothetical protein